MDKAISLLTIKLSHLDRFNIKLCVCSELFKSMVIHKDIFELLSIIEVMFTSPFKKNNELTFYELSSFYSRFFRSNESILSLIHKLHISTYKYEYFPLKSLTHEYGIEVGKYRRIKENLRGNVKSIRLSLPIEALIKQVSNSLSHLELRKIAKKFAGSGTIDAEFRKPKKQDKEVDVFDVKRKI